MNFILNICLTMNNTPYNQSNTTSEMTVKSKHSPVTTPNDLIYKLWQYYIKSDTAIKEKIKSCIDCSVALQNSNRELTKKRFSTDGSVCTFGPMACGKSCDIEIARQVAIEKNLKVLIIVHSNTRGTECTSRNGFSIPCTRTSNLSGIDLTNFDVIIVDECQFFSDICDFITTCKKANKKLFLFGLDKNIFKEWFGSMQKVSDMVDYTNKKQSVCECCGNPADFTMIRDPEVYKNYSPNKPFISTIADYAPCCDKCHPMNK